MANLRMTIEATNYETEIELRLGSQVVHSTTVRAGRNSPQDIDAIIEAARSTLQRSTALGRLRTIQLRANGNQDERIAERIGDQLGIGVAVVL